MSHDKHPVTLLTGFLGSGKTTFMNELMASREDTRFAIIENEVGETGIDGDLVLKSDKNLMEVNNGCLCCTLNDNLLEILKNLYERNEEWDELLIEATGIADPAGVAAPFFNQPGIHNNFELQRIICLVDAGQIEELLQIEGVVAKQIGYCDAILLNKADTVAPSYLKSLKQRLRNSNPLAQIYSGQKGDYPLAEVLSNNGEVISKNLQNGHSSETGHNHDHHDYAHGEINALTFTFEEPFDINLLKNTLASFLMFQAKDVYRLKGIVYDPVYSERLIIQSVMNTVAVERGTPWQSDEEPKSQFVLIGKNLKAKGHERMLRKGLRKSRTV